MWTQFVLRALAELPAIIAAVEHARSQTPGQGAQKLADVNAAMTKIEGDTNASEATIAARLQAIEALVGYANQLAAAERGLRPGRTGGPAAVENQPATPIVSPAKPTLATPTPDQSLEATAAQNDRQREEQERQAAAQRQRLIRSEEARLIADAFGFAPDSNHLSAYLDGRTEVAELVKDMIDRNGKVVPDTLPAHLRPAVV